jgi:hypothetical protein
LFSRYINYYVKRNEIWHDIDSDTGEEVQTHLGELFPHSLGITEDDHGNLSQVRPMSVTIRNKACHITRYDL